MRTEPGAICCRSAWANASTPVWGAPSKAIQGVVGEGCRTAMGEAQALVNVCVVKGVGAGQ